MIFAILYGLFYLVLFIVAVVFIIYFIVKRQGEKKREKDILDREDY